MGTTRLASCAWYDPATRRKSVRNPSRTSTHLPRDKNGLLQTAGRARTHLFEGAHANYLEDLWTFNKGVVRTCEAMPDRAAQRKEVEPPYSSPLRHTEYCRLSWKRQLTNVRLAMPVYFAGHHCCERGRDRARVRHRPVLVQPVLL